MTIMEQKNTYPRMHVSLYVSDVAETIKFYDKFFGIDAAKIEKGYAKYLLSEPALVISFVENADRVKSNFGHLGFQVETRDQMDKYLEIARGENLVSREEIGTSCCFALQDKFWVNDPDGIQWEVYYFHKDVSFNDPKYENDQSESCSVKPAAEGKTETTEPQFCNQKCEAESACC